MNNKRKDNELPLAVSKWGWRYHHIGIPTPEKIKDEKYLNEFKISVGGFSTSPFGIEWMRYEEGCQLPEIIKKIPHVAFEVDNIEVEIKREKFKIIRDINSPSEGIRVAIIEFDGAPIELIEFKK